MNYSVLMTVYNQEDSECFLQAIESMLNQTVLSDDFVLVCDGELGGALNQVIANYDKKLKVIRLDKNIGLGLALNEGLKHCKYDLIARMDSDDISFPERCEKQLEFFKANPELDILSGAVQEFSGERLLKKRILPEKDADIRKWSRKRNPFNHPAVMFRKQSVISAGGYSEKYHFFEDYDLWVRMLKNGAVGANTREVLLNMRVSDDMYKRRGGFEYAKNLLRFHNHLRKTGWISSWIFLTCAVPHAAVCIIPNSMRKMIYRILRK